MLSQVLISASVGLTFLVRVLYLHGALFGSDLKPQDSELEARIKEANLVITDETTMW